MSQPVPRSTVNPDEATLIAMEVLGLTDAMLGPSKTGWRQEHPTEVAIFNANIDVAIAKGSVLKIWHGDFWLSRDHAKLRELADHLGGRIYLLLEQDGRFKNENKPLIGNAIAWVDPGGEVQLNERKIARNHGQIRWVTTVPGER